MNSQMMSPIGYNGILFSLKKEGNPAICDNMDEPGGHYAEWDKSDAEGQLLHDTTYMEEPKIVKLQLSR